MNDGMYWVTTPLPETPEPSDPPDPWGDTKVVGQPVPRVDAYDRVSGSAVYASDMILPDMLYGATLRCPHAHAQVKSLDTSAAEKMPGVRAVITDKSHGADVGWYFGRGGSLSRIFDPHCRFEGEEVAAVAAETPYQAWDAVRAIKVEYEALPAVSTPDEAAKPNAPVILGTSNRTGDPQVYTRGDVAAGFAAADVVKELTLSTGCQIHAPMELFGSVAKWDGGRFLTLWTSTQGVFPVQRAVAQGLKLPLANVRVIGSYVGGGFGSKLDGGKGDIIVALLAKKTGQPVKMFCTREEAMLAMGNRPSVKMTIKAGAKKDGTLTALQMTNVGTGGAYAGSGSVDYVVRDLYLCPNVRTESTDYYTNAGPQRAFRAPGFPQGAWALEQILDELANAIGMDPVELRVKNVPTVSQTQKNLPYSTTGLKECLQEGARTFGWAEARKRGPGNGVMRRGVGVAAGTWQMGNGGPPSTAIVRVFQDGSVNLNIGASDIGCGTKTWAAQIVAEELSVPLDSIRIEHADTGTTQFASASGGSKTVPTEGPAIRSAAFEVKVQILKMAAEQLKLPVEELSLTGPEVVSTKDVTKKVAVSALNGMRSQGVIVGVGYRGPNPTDKVTRPFSAHFAEVEVNTRTGEIKVLRYVAAQDSGRVMNAKTFANQTFGSAIQSTGLALSEARILDEGQTGKMVNANLHDYKLPTALDVAPEPVCVPIDLHDNFNLTGAKGLGEPSTTPAAAVIGNAVANAIGIRVVDAPITPARVCALLGTARRG